VLNDRGATALAHAADVTVPPAIEAALAHFDELGPLRGVVNCAGVVANVPVADTTAELLRGVLEINVVGTFVVMQAARPRLLEAGGGAIVNLSSIAGMRGVTGRTAYSASKAAVIGMSRVWATELARHNIRVNVVAPGPVDTPMVKAAHTASNRQALLASVPMGRYAQPEEIAAAIAFLLDERASSYVTGHVLAVDGGYMAGGAV
jgi:NAD(P)-dependent dehydrogenase (short-subunit alcohol dehydrogenase family)